MIAENPVAHKHNVITLADKEWEFQTFESRPALVRIRDDKVSLFIGEKGNKRVGDGGFIIILFGESKDYSWKLDDGDVPDWATVEKKLAKSEVRIMD